MNPEDAVKFWQTGYTVKMLPTGSIRVDRSYQRQPQALANYIQGDFDPEAFGHLLVARRPRNEYYVVDGFQRLLACKALKIPKVPCIVSKSTGKAHEAEIFRKVNGFRKAVTPMEVFRSAIVAKNETALAILSMVRSCSLDIPLVGHGNPNTARWPNLVCVAALHRLYNLADASPECLETTLKLISESWEEQDEATRSYMIEGLFRFLFYHHRDVDLEKLSKRMGGTTAIKVSAGADTLRAKSREIRRTNKAAYVETVLHHMYRRYKG